MGDYLARQNNHDKIDTQPFSMPKIPLHPGVSYKPNKISPSRNASREVVSFGNSIYDKKQGTSADRHQSKAQPPYEDSKRTTILSGCPVLPFGFEHPGMPRFVAFGLASWLSSRVERLRRKHLRRFIREEHRDHWGAVMLVQIQALDIVEPVPDNLVALYKTSGVSARTAQVWSAVCFLTSKISVWLYL